jgi:hypothetical protein
MGMDFYHGEEYRADYVEISEHGYDELRKMLNPWFIVRRKR